MGCKLETFSDALLLVWIARDPRTLSIASLCR